MKKTYLFVGGPAHSSYRDVEESEAAHSVLVQHPMTGIAEPFYYSKRRISSPTHQREMFVDSDMQPQQFTEALAAAVLQNWIAEGEPAEKKEEVVHSGRTASGLLLPGN